METTPLSIWGRISGETPAFWKKVQISCLILSAAVGYLMNYSEIPKIVLIGLAGFFAAGAFFAQCAVKDVTIVKQAIDDPASLLTNLPAILDQLSTIQDTLKNPPAVALKTVTDIITDAAPAEQIITDNANKPTL